jgi:hypothetical protein
MTRKKIDVFGLVLTSACLLWAIILCIVDFSWATFGGALFVAGLIVLTWILVRRSKPIDHAHPNAHRVDICEGCDPICYADDGRPLSYWDWLSTVHRIEVPAYYQLDSERTYELASAYQAYKAHPKFRNYPRP